MANRITAVAAAAMIAGAGLLSGLVSPQVAQAEGVTNGWQCAQFARLLSGIEIFGDAYTWWRQSMGKYARGSSPDVGAVLVFSAISYSWGWIPNVWFMLDRDRAVRVLTRFRAAIAKHDIAIITAALMVVGLYLLIFGLVTE